MRIVIAGVAGSGKSTIGAALAERLGSHFVDGDDLHPQANIDKMTAGVPLDDADRRPWLDAIVDRARTDDQIVLACSALRESHRDRLRQIPDVRFVFLDLEQAVAEARAAARTDHFMGAAMVESQFATLETPTPDEPDVMILDGTRTVEDLVKAIEQQSTEFDPFS